MHIYQRISNSYRISTVYSVLGSRMSEATFCSRASLGVVQESEDDRRNKQAGQDLQAGFQSTKSSSFEILTCAECSTLQHIPTQKADGTPSNASEDQGTGVNSLREYFLL